MYSTSYGTEVVVAGGGNVTADFDDVEIFNPDTGEWRIGSKGYNSFVTEA